MWLLVRGIEGDPVRRREIALRCAAAMDRDLLRHNWPRDEQKRELYGLSVQQYQHRAIDLIRQLDACKDDAARRLITGRSK